MNAAHKYDILENHNDYDINIIRKRAEEIRNDPLGIGFAVKGVTVSHKQALSNYAQELVANHGKYEADQYYLTLDMLEEDERNELARLYIEATNRETNECIYGDDFTINSEFNCALLALLQNDTKETRDNFAEVTLRNIIIYYQETLNEVLDDACNQYFNNQMNEQGYFQEIDLEHGDVFWRKY